MITYRFENLQFAYGITRVLQGISGEISRGEFVAVVGPNGAGKSTFLKLAAGLLRHYEGTIEFYGTSLKRIRPRDLAQKAAFVPQETHVVFPFTVAEIVLMGRLPRRSNGFFDSHGDLAQAQLAMELTDTAALARKPFGELSGGERQRVVLASALAQEPEILLLDEPTVFLDLKHQLQFYDILERLNQERHLTIISVTHDLNLAACYTRRMIAVHAGRFAADGPPEAVLTPQRLREIFEITADVCRRPDGRGSFIVPTKMEAKVGANAEAP